MRIAPFAPQSRFLKTGIDYNIKKMEGQTENPGIAQDEKRWLYILPWHHRCIPVPDKLHTRCISEMLRGVVI